VAESDLILIVEDREDDVLLLQRAFRKASLKNPVQFVRTGEEAIAYLSGEGQFSSRAEFPLPVLILLDLKLPGKDGFEVLSWVRQNDGLQILPVIILTSSNHISDVNRAYRLGANSFLVKDLDFHQTVVLSVVLRDYWLTRAAKPEAHRPPPKPSKT
jgi:CheY-like chemotaxis protein